MKISRLSASVAAFAAIGLLAACGGGGGGGTGGTNPPVNNPPPPTSSSPSPTPTPTATPTQAPPTTVAVSTTDYDAYDGPTWGKDNWQTNGVTASDKGDGDIVNNVGTGQSITENGVTLSACAMPNESGAVYHVHAFVGIYVNGTAYAIPDAIGMANPDSNEPVQNFSCAYSVHTHGSSGIIHVEDSVAHSSPPPQFNLQTLFDIWGQSINSVAGASGPPTIYVGQVSGKDSAGRDLVNSYSVYTGSPSSLLLTHHEAIFLVYGALPTSTNGNACPSGTSGCLPQISFGISS